MKKIAPFLLAILLCCLGGCGQKARDVASSSAVPASATPDEPESTATSADTTLPLDASLEETAQDRVDEIISASLRRPSSALKVEELFQYPELPTGCEVVSLAAALHYLGFDIEKTELAEEYLLYNDEDMTAGFSGDPFSEYGAGIFPPALVSTANSYLSAQKSNIRAVNTTGISLDDLYKLLDSGCPVLVWYTVYGNYPAMTEEVYTCGGKNYYWYENEHCVVLCGYDNKEQTVTVSDPLDGYAEYDSKEFSEIYDEIGRLSMTLTKVENGT